MKTLRTICFAIVATIAMVSAKAQYTIDVKQPQLENYRSMSYSLKLSEICEALETDTASFAADFYDFKNYPKLVTLESDNHSTNYTQGDGGRGYWMSADGKSQAWPNCTFCVLPYPDTESNQLVFAFWQMPGVAVIGDKYHCIIAINYNDNQVTFDINVTVVEKEDLGLTTELAKLNVLGTIETTTTQEPRDSYSSDQISMDINSAIEALGFDAQKLSENFSDYLYMGWLNNEYDAKDEILSNTWTANSGFWTGLFYDDMTGKETGELINGVNSSEWKVYIEAFKLNPATGVLTANVGQNPNQVKHGVKWWIPMYLINGDKAYILRVNFNTTESNPDDEPLDFASQTKAGSQDIVVNEWPNGNYKAWNVAIDIDSIAELVGCKKSDIKLRAEMSEGVISFNTTANNGGYWIDKDGFVCTWGQGSVLSVEPSNGLSTLYCMQMPGVVQVGEVYTYRMYLVGKRAYYQLNFTINIGEQPTFDFSEYTLAAEEMYEFQIVPGDGDWNNEHMQEGIPLGAEHLSELLGDGSYTFLGEIQTDDGRVLVTDEYTCDPHPAFWMTGSYVHAHNGQNSYGILYTANEAKFQFVKQPGFNQVGESYVGNFWLANPETKKYIHYTIYIEYVDEIVNYVTVGNESLALPCNGEEGDYAETPVDMSKCLNALGCDLDQFEEAGQWKVRNSNGKFTSEGYEDEMYGFWFDAEGNPTTDEEAKCYAIEFLDQDASDCGENCFRTYAFTNNTYNAVICAEYNGNRYIFNVVISSDSADGIDTVADDTLPKSKKGIYNLTGQRVTSLQHGLYIVDGKKVYVK